MSRNGRKARCENRRQNAERVVGGIHPLLAMLSSPPGTGERYTLYRATKRAARTWRRLDSPTRALRVRRERHAWRTFNRPPRRTLVDGIDANVLLAVHPHRLSNGHDRERWEMLAQGIGQWAELFEGVSSACRAIVEAAASVQAPAELMAPRLGSPGAS